MPWYAAHAIVYFEYTDDGPQDGFELYENIYLIQAETSEAGYAKAGEVAKRVEGDDSGSLRAGGRPIKRVFGGIRKLVTVLGAHEVGARPDDGDEITYSELHVADRDALQKLIDDKDVDLTYFGARNWSPETSEPAQENP